jgi:hypothetical protein
LAFTWGASLVAGRRRCVGGLVHGPVWRSPWWCRRRPGTQGFSLTRRCVGRVRLAPRAQRVAREQSWLRRAACGRWARELGELSATQPRVLGVKSGTQTGAQEGEERRRRNMDVSGTM